MKICKYAILLGCVFSIPLWAQLEGWGDERQLTNNSVADIMPDVDFGDGTPKVVWVSESSVVLVYRQGDTTWTDTMRLSPDNLIDNRNPSINGDVVWQAQDDSGFGIYYWNSYPWNTVEIASSPDTLGHPHISNSDLYSGNRAVVWEGWDGNDWEIYFREAIWEYPLWVWDSIIVLTDNNYEDRYSSISAKTWYDSLHVRYDSIWVVWESFDGNDYEIMCRTFNGESWDSVLPLTDNLTDDRFPCASEGLEWGEWPMTIIWQKWDGQDWEICMRSNEGGTWSPETLLTNNSIDDENPSSTYGCIKGPSGIIVWQRWDGEDYEIIARERYDSLWEPEIQLSEEDSLDDINPRVSMCPPCVKKWGYSGICVVWEGDDGNDKEIYYRCGYSYGGGVEESAKFNPLADGQTARLEISPNPFIHSTAIKYCLPAKSKVSLAIYDIGGRKVAELVKGVKSPGEHTAHWETDNISNGVYFCVFKSEKKQLVKKFVVIK